MYIMKSVEITAESSRSSEDAIQVAISRFSKTVRGLASCHINSMSTTIKDARIDMYRVNMQMTFQVDAAPEKPGDGKKKK
jgi:flavin-binding protein dodecin